MNGLKRGSGRSITQRLSRACLAGMLFGLTTIPVAAAEEVAIDSGSTAWMIMSTVLVILMAVPGLALFYGGMVRAKNMLSVSMQVFVTFSLLSIVWAEHS